MIFDRKSTVVSALLASTVSTVAMAQTTIIQSNTGIGCSTVCINGNCTSNCGEGSTSVTVGNADVMKGNGDIVTREVEEKDFTSVVSSDIDTSIVQGESFSITVRADSNLQERIEVKRDGDNLYVRLKNGQYQDATLSVEITMPNLRSLTQNGAATLQFTGFEQSSLELNVNGAGEIQGSDNMLTNLVLNSQGASSLDMMSSELTNAEVHVAGSAEIRLNFPSGEGRITGDVQGVSEIYYCGNPDNQVSVFGVADIQRIDCS